MFYSELSDLPEQLRSTCCFTGHRPSRFHWKYNETHPDCIKLKESLKREIVQLYLQGVTKFITGMAIGTDMYCGEIVLELQEKICKNILLESARPCESQADKWSDTDKTRYHKILSGCYKDTLLQHEYDRNCMMKRNEYMVKESGTVLAVFDGQRKGGTFKTMQFATRYGREKIVLSATTGEITEVGF